MVIPTEAAAAKQSRDETVQLVRAVMDERQPLRGLQALDDPHRQEADAYLILHYCLIHRYPFPRPLRARIPDHTSLPMSPRMPARIAQTICCMTLRRSSIRAIRTGTSPLRRAGLERIEFG